MKRTGLAGHACARAAPARPPATAIVDAPRTKARLFIRPNITASSI
jgi:hypothetical protein